MADEMLQSGTTAMKESASGEKQEKERGVGEGGADDEKKQIDETNREISMEILADIYRRAERREVLDHLSEFCTIVMAEKTARPLLNQHPNHEALLDTRHTAPSRAHYVREFGNAVPWMEEYRGKFRLFCEKVCQYIDRILAPNAETEQTTAKTEPIRAGVDPMRTFDDSSTEKAFQSHVMFDAECLNPPFFKKDAYDDVRRANANASNTVMPVVLQQEVTAEGHRANADASNTLMPSVLQQDIAFADKSPVAIKIDGVMFFSHVGSVNAVLRPSPRLSEREQFNFLSSLEFVILDSDEEESDIDSEEEEEEEDEEEEEEIDSIVGDEEGEESDAEEIDEGEDEEEELKEEGDEMENDDVRENEKTDAKSDAAVPEARNEENTVVIRDNGVSSSAIVGVGANATTARQIGTQRRDVYNNGIDFFDFFGDQCFSLAVNDWSEWMRLPVIVDGALDDAEIIAHCVFAMMRFGLEYRLQWHEFGKIVHFTATDYLQIDYEGFCNLCSSVLIAEFTGHHRCAICNDFDYCTRCYERLQRGEIAHASDHPFVQILTTQQQQNTFHRSAHTADESDDFAGAA